MLMLAGGVGVMPGIGDAAVTGSQTGGDITLPDGTTLIADQTLNGGLYGILVPNGTAGTVETGSGSTVSVTDVDHFAQGIFLNGANSDLHANKLIVTVSGKTASAIELTGNQSSADLGTGSSVTAVGSGSGFADGVTVKNASTLTAEKLQISTQGDNGIGLHVSGYGTEAGLGNDSAIQTNGTSSNAVQIDAFTGQATDSVPLVTANHLTIKTLGDSSQGINIQADSSVDLGSNSTIITTGETSVGIWSLGTLTADHLNISTSGTASAGLSVRGNGLADVGAGSVIFSAQTGAIVAMGDSATVNYLGTETERNTLQSAGSYGASSQSAGATVNLLNTDITINSVDTLGLGLWALGGQINGENLTITGLPDSTIGVYAMAEGEVNLQGDLTIDMGSPEGVAMATQHNEGYAPSVINADGTMAITGSVNSLGGLIDLNFASGSLWSGSANSDNVNGGHLNVNLTDSEWRVAGDSVLDNLQMSNSLVDLTAATDDSSYSTLTVANLSGSGNFALRTDIVGDGDGVNNIGDKVVVTESSAGDYTLLIQNRGSAVTTGNEVLTVVETPDGVATFKGDSDVELGGYVYTVNQQDTNWVLSSPKAEAETPADDAEATPVDPADNGAVTPVDPADNGAVTPVDPADNGAVTPVNPADNGAVTPVDPVDNGATAPVTPGDNATITPASPADNTAAEPDKTGDQSSASPAAPAGTAPAASGPSVISSTANAGANFLNIGYLMNYAETQTLMQRMGDVRQGKTAGNVWLRGIDGRFSGFASGKLSNFSLNYTGYQFGVDKRVSDEIPLYLGLFMGVTEGSPHYRDGDGNTRSSHVGMYSTWMNDEGYYVDGVVKFNRFKNQFSVKDTQNNRVSGTAASYGFSVSLEAGKKFIFSENANGFYLEPQLQMTAGYQDSSSLRASNGLNISLSNYKSVLGRASVLAGYEMHQSGYKLNSYIKTGMMREFSGDTHYALNGSRENLSFKGNGWNNGIGVSAQISNHTLFMEADLVDGNRFNQRQINAGYRFSF
ncbi:MULTISPECIES: autotransporter outer membrane beta-barrel domain-containing protein [Pantoea]|uniref:autotransporter outer membrane beta-barrel domain-containing protein n=1 Tax=Pantoea TaxID=53335 RepID=UPI001F1A28C0|nr:MULTISPECIES: autotransporter outer membrane beta-barrel domain-containing protein [Pantoea]UIL54915.1 autotransporter outer membrane beta-barrel domain-containing protein [Pantoea agglomerans]